MTHRRTFYYIEAKDTNGNYDGIVPHSGKGKNANTDFIDKKKAIDFLTKLKLLNQNNAFRICKRVTIIEEGNWIK